MSALPSQVRDLIERLKKLPGIGARSAERIALFLVRGNAQYAIELADAIVNAARTVHPCTTCGALTDRSPCAICTDPRRDPSVICVVEQPTDVLRIEKTGLFRGRYHVLGGKISPVNNVSPEALRIEALANRLRTEPVTELILALSTDMEGEATSMYLAKQFASPQLKITRIAYGLPAGAGLDYADDFTIGQALEWRRQIG